ncbi:MAG: orotidine-5'-phosphate decarboxylase [Bacillota bacterium]|jgi:orotidine-5'-phosphate decarboxylase
MSERNEFMKQGSLFAAAREKLIVALDVSTRKEAFDLVKLLDGHVGAFKIGMQLYNSEGPDIVRDIQLLGGKVFVDLKFHDIPNTVAQVCRVITDRGAFMLTLHASGGYKMMKAAVDSIADQAVKIECTPPISLAVTVLTSISQEDFKKEMGITRPLADQVVHWAKLAQEAGISGVVSSPWEITSIRKACGDDFIIVTPGVRPVWSLADDQKRIMTPQEAVERGASYLVVGRPIAANPDPVAAAQKIVNEMAEGLKKIIKK